MRKSFLYVAMTLALLLVHTSASALVVVSESGSADLGPGGDMILFGPYVYGDGQALIWEEGTIIEIQGTVFLSPEDEAAIQDYLDLGYYFPAIHNSWGDQPQGLSVVNVFFGPDWTITPLQPITATTLPFTSDFSDYSVGDYFEFSIELHDLFLYPPLNGTDAEEITFPTRAHVEWTITAPANNAVPEPSTMILLGSGLVGAFLKRRRT